ncbi:hypothetical protein HN695_08040 [Candidatus Woesearchaeota archaeon]|jgi:hypothetical protein|nr:hypothetical protein [Candidatus Woesearchaeota archaeon]MBT5272491.1 hypothetical protein [Candidatus Woesearchaeota archaeon]MBT6041501.1 hypothetical protein [Candidatus Woesearchaeota archaeon]MBT6336353.1 hypothetical protein [Candidatus Woesearchaeota archaeon]MBT7928255.1 hypothetical protein [Candidatus Woesearchaeota archaeon]
MALYVNKSYSDPVKQLSRDVVVDFVRKHYQPHEIRKLKVACFPGPEMLEVTHQWDQLGIQRRNVYGFESHPQSYQRLCERVSQETKKSRIKTFNEDVADFLERENQRFDIIFLDYDGFFGRNVDRVLHAISEEQRLAERGIVGINVREGREHKKRQRDYLMSLSHFSMDETNTPNLPGLEIPHAGKKKLTIDEHADRIIAINDYMDRKIEERDYDLTEIRNSVFTRTILTRLFQGKRLDQMPNLFVEGVIREHVEHYKRFFTELNAKTDGRFFRNDPKLEEAVKSDDIDYIPNLPGFKTTIIDALYENTGLSVQEVAYFYSKERFAYYMQDHDCFKYISKPGNVPMIGDLFLFDQRRDLFDSRIVKYWALPAEEGDKAYGLARDFGSTANKRKKAAEKAYKKAEKRRKPGAYERYRQEVIKINAEAMAAKDELLMDFWKHFVIWNEQTHQFEATRRLLRLE